MILREHAASCQIVKPATPMLPITNWLIKTRPPRRDERDDEHRSKLNSRQGGTACDDRNFWCPRALWVSWLLRSTTAIGGRWAVKYIRVSAGATYRSVRVCVPLLRGLAVDKAACRRCGVVPYWLTNVCGIARARLSVHYSSLRTNDQNVIGIARAWLGAHTVEYKSLQISPVDERSAHPFSTGTPYYIRTQPKICLSNR